MVNVIQSYLHVSTNFRLICVCVLTGLESIKAYIDSFKYGAPPHAGGGIGKPTQNTKYYFFKNNLACKVCYM